MFRGQTGCLSASIARKNSCGHGFWPSRSAHLAVRVVLMPTIGIPASKDISSERRPSRAMNPQAPPNIPRVRRAGDPNHPARARASALRPTAEVSPSVSAAQNEFKNLMHDLCGTLRDREGRLIAKASRAASAQDVTKCIDGRVSKHSWKKAAIVRRQHTSDSVFSRPSTHTRKAQLKSCATDPDIGSREAAHQDEQPIAGPSSIIARVLFKSRLGEPEYDFPSSTPTPPPKYDPTSCSSSSGSRGSYSPPAASFHHTWSHLADNMDTTGFISESHCESSSASSPQEDDSPMVHDNHRQSSVASRAVSPEPTPVPYVSPPALASISPPPSSASRMPPPPLPAPRHSQATTAVPTSTPCAPPVARPSQAQGGASQSERPRSQHPPPLGMLRRHGVGAKFQTKSKPFKVPFAVKKDPSGHRVDRRPDSGPVGTRDSRRSLSPIIPDPPHIAARVQTAEASQPMEEMTARRPEPMVTNEDDDEVENQDANSSADLWANVDDIEGFL